MTERKSQVKFSNYLDNCENTLIILRGRNNKMKNDFDGGMMSEKDMEQTRSRINQVILDLIDEAELIPNMKELERQVKEAPTLKLDVDFDTFSEDDYKALEKALKEVLPEGAKLNLLGVKKGSVEVMLEISEEDMVRLLLIIKNEDFLKKHKFNKIEFRSMKNVEKPVTREDNISLLNEKLEKFRNDEIQATDSGIKFKLGKQIEEMEKELIELKKNV